MNNKIVRTISFFLIVLLLLSGCVGPNGTTEPGKTTEPGQTTEQPSSEQGTDTPSEVVIRTLADQQSEWTEGQYFPGSYKQEKTPFTIPSMVSSFVLEADGIVYACSSQQNADNTGMMHVLRKTAGTKKEDMILSEIIAALPPRTVLLYISDHGESTDTGRWRDATSRALWSVPVFVYPADAAPKIATVSDFVAAWRGWAR